MSKYLNEFLKMKCSHDLMELGVFNTMDELTEVAGLYKASEKFFRHIIDKVKIVTDDLIVAKYFVFRQKEKEVYLDYIISYENKSIYGIESIHGIKSITELPDNTNILYITKDIKNFHTFYNRIDRSKHYFSVITLDDKSKKRYIYNGTKCYSNSILIKSKKQCKANYTFKDKNIISKNNIVRVWNIVM